MGTMGVNRVSRRFGEIGVWTGIVPIVCACLLVSLGSANAVPIGATPTPMPGTGGAAAVSVGPPLTAFAIANANGCAACNNAGCLCNSGPVPTPMFDAQGRRIFERSGSSGFIIVVEGGPTVGGPLPAVCSTTQRPVLQIETNRQLGLGPTPPAVCPGGMPTPTPDLTRSIPAFPTPDFSSTSAVTIALQEFAHRFGTFPSGGACTLDANGNQNFLNAAQTSTQFCYLTSTTHAFQVGDTILTALLTDASGNPGPTSQIVVRVSGSGGSTFGISGHLRYYSSLSPVSGATVQLQGPAPSSTQSDANGLFAFSNLAMANWQIIPQKLGDNAIGVSALDAVYVLQAALGLRSLSTQQRLACDVSGNGAVSALDAALILQFAVHLITRFPVALACNSDWVFAPAVSGPGVIQPVINALGCQPGSIAYQPLSANADNQDFAAVLFGDCTGNWQHSGGGAASLASADANASTVRLGRPRRRGQVLRVPVYVRSQSGFQGITAQVQYDAAQLKSMGARRLPGARGALFVENNRTPGLVEIGLASAEKLTSGSPLLLQFEMKDVGRQLPQIHLLRSSVVTQ